MEKSTHTILLKSIQENYPLGLTYLKDWKKKIDNRVGEKIDGLSEELSKWRLLVQELKEKGYVIHDHCFLQFPNLLFIAEQCEKVENIYVYKSLVTCLSLLCPFFTSFYEYKHKVKLEDGLLTLNAVVFNQEKRFRNLKPDLSIADIKYVLGIYFPSYRFVDHQALMNNSIDGAVPYGIDANENEGPKYSFYQFLFNNVQPDSKNIFS